MAGTSKKADSGREGGRALDYVKTRQEAKAASAGQQGGGKAKPGVKAAGAVNPKDDSPKRQGDKLASARGKGDGPTSRQRKDAPGDPSHDSPKRQGDKLENATRAAAGRARTK
jgi:hypothetical protein